MPTDYSQSHRFQSNFSVISTRVDIIIIIPASLTMSTTEVGAEVAAAGPGVAGEAGTRTIRIALAVAGASGGAWDSIKMTVRIAPPVAATRGGAWVLIVFTFKSESCFNLHLSLID
jgi:hypothetical protein